MSLKNLSAKNKIPKLFKDKLNNKRVNKIYKNFEKSIDLNQNFIVAVSGGPDSLALAFLTKRSRASFTLEAEDISWREQQTHSMDYQSMRINIRY